MIASLVLFAFTVSSPSPRSIEIDAVKLPPRSVVTVTRLGVLAFTVSSPAPDPS